MKKLLFISTLLFSALCTNAQKMLGVQAGLNFASYKRETAYSTKGNTGIILGAVANIDLSNCISFRPELNFIQKGGEWESNSFTAQNTFQYLEKIKLNYFQLSPNFVYNISVGVSKIFIGLGPEISLGMGGNFYIKESRSSIGFFTSNTETDKKIKFDGESNHNSDDKYHFKLLDYGVNILAGYNIANKFFVSTGYSFGLANISPDEFKLYKNRGFNVKLGYMVKK